jgi:hypothetical protein
MVKTKKTTPEFDIKKFKQYFLNEHGVEVRVYTQPKADNRTPMNTFLKCALTALHKNQPCFNHITSISYNLRQRDFLVYLQAVSYLAWEEGHSKKIISLHVKRTYATVLNSIKEIENGISIRDTLIVNAINNISIELQNYVGNISENIKE